MPQDDYIRKLRRLSRSRSPFRALEAIEAGVPSMALTRLTRTGTLNRVGRGLYELANAKGSSHAELIEASLLVPKGIVVLLSALNFHGIGTQPAREVWMQIPANSPTPKVNWPPLRIVRSRLSSAFSEGVETHKLGGHSVRITGIDRTIVDCFKHRNLVTMEVCLEALRERVRNRRHSLQDLNRYARIMRVSRIMQPYLEALA